MNLNAFYGLPDPAGNIAAWAGTWNPDLWIATILVPFLITAGTVRLVYLLIRPRVD